jgi:hypothetical protein
MFIFFLEQLQKEENGRKEERRQKDAVLQGKNPPKPRFFIFLFQYNLILFRKIVAGGGVMNRYKSIDEQREFFFFLIFFIFISFFIIILERDITKTLLEDFQINLEMLT